MAHGSQPYIKTCLTSGSVPACSLSWHSTQSTSRCRDYTPRPPLLEVFMAPHHLYLIDGQYLSGCPCHYSMHIGYHGGSVAIQVSILCWKTSYRQSHVSG